MGETSHFLFSRNETLPFFSIGVFPSRTFFLQTFQPAPQEDARATETFQEP